MFGWGKSGKRARLRTVETLLAALNARDYAAARRLLTDDFTYVDTAGSRIENADDYIEAQRALHARAPDLQGAMEDYSAVQNGIMVKGCYSSEDPRFAVDGMWNLEFRGDLICAISTFRAGNAIPLVQILRQARGGGNGGAPRAH